MNPDSIPLWVQLLSALGVPTIITSVVLGAGKFLETWRSRKSALTDRQEAREETEENRQTRWNMTVRQNIEKHVPWDAKVGAKVTMHEALINQLREHAGLEPIDFETLPEPPPLFPDFPPTV